jgi:hypothetical protein
MPTAAEFDQAAERFSAAAERLVTLLDPPFDALTPEVLTGGTLTALVTRSLDINDMTLGQASAECLDLAEECRVRAEVARQYAADLAAWERSMDTYDSAMDDYHDQVCSPDDRPPTSPGPAPYKPPYVDL